MKEVALPLADGWAMRATCRMNQIVAECHQYHFNGMIRRRRWPSKWQEKKLSPFDGLWRGDQHFR
eukprot:m.210579 g.210579  ORF g.210579 m.210579 type:complete len:65 (-) comp26128_c0_seq11:819-1013(-)